MPREKRRPPFVGDDFRGVVSESQQGSLPDVRLFRPGLPEGVNAVIATAMARMPADRYAGAGLFAAALSAALAGESA